MQYVCLYISKQTEITSAKVSARENFDPLGVHTGDSIVIAPSQTFSDEVNRSQPSLSLPQTEYMLGISHASYSGDQDCAPSRRLR